MEKLITNYYSMLINSEEASMCRNIMHDTKKENDAFYPYIPSYNSELIELWKIVRKIKNKKNKKFVDIGSGYPAISKIMSGLGFKSFAIEINRSICKIAENGRYSRDVEMINKNILEYDSTLAINTGNEDCFDFDVLYMYNPIRNDELMIKAINIVVSKMKSGSVLLFNSASRSVDDFLQEKLGAKRYAGGKMLQYKKK